jgi:hypothetical protein
MNESLLYGNGALPARLFCPKLYLIFACSTGLLAALVNAAADQCTRGNAAIPGNFVAGRTGLPEYLIHLNLEKAIVEKTKEMMIPGRTQRRAGNLGLIFKMHCLIQAKMTEA